MILGERIEQRRKALGIKNHSALARLVGIPQSTMSGLIKNPYRWSPHLVQIAATLQTSVAYLTGATDDPDANAPPPPPPVAPVIMMAVTLPPERALARMFEVMLAGIDRQLPQAEQALLLAKRLPIGLSQLRDLLPASANVAPASVPAAAPAASPPTRHPESTR